VAGIVSGGGTGVSHDDFGPQKKHAGAIATPDSVNAHVRSRTAKVRNA